MWQASLRMGEMKIRWPTLHIFYQYRNVGDGLYIIRELINFSECI